MRMIPERMVNVAETMIAPPGKPAALQSLSAPFDQTLVLINSPAPYAGLALILTTSSRGN